jgi:hypothetical protein
VFLCWSGSLIISFTSTLCLYLLLLFPHVVGVSAAAAAAGRSSISSSSTDKYGKSFANAQQYSSIRGEDHVRDLLQNAGKLVDCTGLSYSLERDSTGIVCSQTVSYQCEKPKRLTGKPLLGRSGDMFVKWQLRERGLLKLTVQQNGCQRLTASLWMLVLLWHVVPRHKHPKKQDAWDQLTAAIGEK